MQLARSAILLVGTILFFFGLSYMPVADTLALFFISPLVATLLSPWMLKEKVGPRRSGAVLVGFIGALIILQARDSASSAGRHCSLRLRASATASMPSPPASSPAPPPPLVTAGFTALVGAVVMSVSAPLYLGDADACARPGIMLADRPDRRRRPLSPDPGL